MLSRLCVESSGYDGEMGRGGGGSSIVLHPAVLLDKGINHFLHGQVWDQLVLGQGTPGDRVKVTHSLHRDQVNW